MTRWVSLAARAKDDRGSLPMVLLVTVVGMLLTGMLVPVLLNQDHSTRFDTSRVTSLDASQAGLDVAMGKIRSARTTSDTGDPSKLPCATTTNPIQGSVDATGAITYTVTIAYYTADPTSTPAPTPMACSAGYGTYGTDSHGNGVVTPSYAKVTSIGYGGAGNGASKGRTLTATYKFKMNNFNLPGGVIRVFPASDATSQFCLDAGSATPAVGGTPTMQVCSATTPPVDQQTFVYRTDLTLQLKSSVTDSNANGLCLSYSSASAGVAVTFAKCAALGSAPWTQQWSFDDLGQFHASLSTTATTGKGELSTVCLDAGSLGVSFSSSSDQVTFANAPGLAAGSTISFRNVSGANGVSSDQSYYVRSVVDATHVTLSTSRNGSTLNITSNGTGGAILSSPVAGDTVIVDTCRQATMLPPQAWIPAPSVGAGAAVAPQLVNYAEFGRCLDVTGQDPKATFLIDYPC
jgi:hypothetical protein